jgi:hypothetical protein
LLLQNFLVIYKADANAYAATITTSWSTGFLAVAKYPEPSSKHLPFGPQKLCPSPQELGSPFTTHKTLEGHGPSPGGGRQVPNCAAKGVEAEKKTDVSSRNRLASW